MPAQALAKVANEADAWQDAGGVLMKWAGGNFEFSDLLIVASAAGRLRGGCFVIDTPVAVGWNYEPIVVRQAFQPDTIADQAVPVDTAAADDGTINLGWMIAGIGIVATTVYLRNKRDEDEERKKQRSRRLIFANGKFVDELEDPNDPSEGPLEFAAEGEIELPPLGRGGQGGARGTVMDASLPKNATCSSGTRESSDASYSALLNSREFNDTSESPSRHDRLLATDSNQGNNQTPESSSMSTTATTILRLSTPSRSTSSVVECAVSLDPTGGLIPTYVGTRPKIRNLKSHIRNLFWCVPLLLAGLCFWKGLPSADRSAQSTATAAIKAPVASTLQLAPAPQATKRTLITRPIQDIRPGHRVIAKNPELAGQDVPQLEIDPETTRLVSLHLAKPDGHEVEIDTLMSFDELLAVAVENLDAQPSLVCPVGTLPLPLVGSDEDVSLNELLIGQVVELNLPELGAEGPATITSMRPCPPIEPDDGTGRRVVTSVFRHSAANVIDLEMSGSSEIIGVTANHPFWSEDRREFVPAGELRLYDNLRQADGTLVQVTRTTPRRGQPVPVFNFEVDGEHVYSVGTDGFLVHNACAGKQARLRQLLNDPNVSRSIRGWIRQELNQIARGTRDTIRLPGSSRIREIAGRIYGGNSGKVLAHRRGMEARKGFSYMFADLQDKMLHLLQHAWEGYK